MTKNFKNLNGKNSNSMICIVLSNGEVVLRSVFGYELQRFQSNVTNAVGISSPPS
jgi:hypothetical protein